MNFFAKLIKAVFFVVQCSATNTDDQENSSKKHQIEGYDRNYPGAVDLNARPYVKISGYSKSSKGYKERSVTTSMACTSKNFFELDKLNEKIKHAYSYLEDFYGRDNPRLLLSLDENNEPNVKEIDGMRVTTGEEIEKDDAGNEIFTKRFDITN